MLTDRLIFGSPQAQAILKTDKLRRAQEDAEHEEAEARAHGPMRNYRVLLAREEVDEGTIQAHTLDEAWELAKERWARSEWQVDAVEEIT